MLLFGSDKVFQVRIFLRWHSRLHNVLSIVIQVGLSLSVYRVLWKSQYFGERQFLKKSVQTRAEAKFNHGKSSDRCTPRRQLKTERTENIGSAVAPRPAPRVADCSCTFCYSSRSQKKACRDIEVARGRLCVLSEDQYHQPWAWNLPLLFTCSFEIVTLL